MITPAHFSGLLVSLTDNLLKMFAVMLLTAPPEHVWKISGIPYKYEKGFRKITSNFQCHDDGSLRIYCHGNLLESLSAIDENEK